MSELDYYLVSENYWNMQPATNNGMLGGFDFVSDIDIEQSQKFLDSYTEVIILLDKANSVLSFVNSKNINTEDRKLQKLTY